MTVIIRKYVTPKLFFMIKLEVDSSDGRCGVNFKQSALGGQTAAGLVGEEALALQLDS